MTPEDVETFASCVAAGGVAVFPTDTVYGLACEPTATDAVRRLHALKRRRQGKPAAVMFFDPELAQASLPDLGPRTRAALGALLPGPVTVLVANPARRFPLACGPEPMVLGIRVPRLGTGLELLGDLRLPVLQTSANQAGAPDARRLEDVVAEIRAGADMLLDGGELPGVASTVLDLRAYEGQGAWHIVRPGAVGTEAIEAALG